jgi:hypothetical protein
MNFMLKNVINHDNHVLNFNKDTNKCTCTYGT